MATEVEATYRVVTPMFCGGANPNHAELRVPSFKGALRFWWRALAWSRLNGELQTIRDQEDRLFGSAGEGQSAASVAMESDDYRSGAGKALRIGPGARYLGYGIVAAADGRGFLYPGFKFTVRMRIREPHPQIELQSLKEALIALGLFGGMGARSRRGFGSVAIDSLLFDRKKSGMSSKSAKDLITRIRHYRRNCDSVLVPAYTALSNQSRYVVIQNDSTDPLGLLDTIGREIKDAIRAVPRDKRIIFGLPRKPHPERRASPLFIHIHECAGKPVAVLSFLPARFLPRGKSDISVGGSRIRQQPEEDLYRPVHDFLERLKRCETLHAEEVSP